MNETQILQMQCHNICKLNSSRKAEDNATSRWLHRIPPPSEAGGFQTAGLKDSEISSLREWNGAFIQMAGIPNTVSNVKMISSRQPRHA
jgi:hypothetical protein